MLIIPIVDAVVVGFVLRELNQSAGVCVKTGDGYANVTIDVENSLVRFLLEKLRSDDFFHGKDDAVLAADGDGGTRFVDCLGCIVDLENASVGGELRGVEIVSGADGAHFGSEIFDQLRITSTE